MTAPNRASRRSLRQRPVGCQSGQALVIALGLLLAGGAMLHAMFSAGQVAAAKQRLTDTADAAAWSAGAWRARVLNYHAYSNRAILVNEVAPGIVDAGLSGRIMREDPALREKLLGLTPAGSLVTAADVARGVALLCDPATTQAIGSTLLLDGGMSLLPPGG